MSYQYSKLDIKKHEIRVLILHSGARLDSVQCHLQACSLDGKVNYEDLSYTWGNPLPRYYIEIDSSPMSVGPSLYIALIHLRHPTKPRILWIDALCINQEDLKERGEQVGQMRMVYSCAANVLVWLGREDQNSDAAMRLVAEIDNIDLKTFRSNNDHQNRGDWDALFDLLRRPRWNRVWIVQEVAVGKMDPLVGYGSYWVPWSKFELLDQVLGELEEIGAKVVDDLKNPISRLRMIRAGAQRGANTAWRNFFLLLRATHDCQATDARDKVFALLGLTSEADQLAIRLDYTSSVVDLFTTVAKHIIKSDESLNVLMYFKPSKLPNLPSWVPDFNSSRFKTHMGEPHGRSGASGDSKPSIEFLNDSTISVHGWILDEIRKISLEEYDVKDPDAGVSNFEKLARKTLPTVQTVSDVANLQGTFWRCLVADRTLNCEFPAPDSYRYFCSVFRGETPVPKSFKHNEDDTRRKEAYLFQFMLMMQATLSQGRFFITYEGRLGVGSLDTKKGDLMVILQGADVPFVIRARETVGYTLLREAYVSGLMFGEMFTGQNRLDSDDQRYTNLRIY